MWACLLQNVADPVIGSLDTLLTLQLGRARDSLRWLELLRVVQLSLKRPVALPGEVQMGNIGYNQPATVSVELNGRALTAAKTDGSRVTYAVGAAAFRRGDNSIALRLTEQTPSAVEVTAVELQVNYKEP